MEDTVSVATSAMRSDLHTKFAISFLHVVSKRPIRVDAERSSPIDDNGWTRIFFRLRGDVASYVTQVSGDGRETTMYLLHDDKIINKFVWPPNDMKNLGQDLTRMPVIAHVEIEGIAVWARFDDTDSLAETQLDSPREHVE